jgi:Capsule polysaccharide biosynthesis protein
MTNVLIYARPWNATQFFDLASRTWPEASVDIISEHADVDQSGFLKYFYSYFEESKKYPNIMPHIEFDNDEVSSIVLRCRLLRSISYNLALQLIFSASNAISQVLYEQRPNYVLSVTVDSYIIDLLARLSRKKGARFIGLVPTFVNGYFRITERGEKAVNREVSADEVESVLAMLTDQKYKPQWLAPDRGTIRKKAVKLWARNLVKPMWFAFYSRWKNDPLNAHYMTTDIVSRRFLSLFPRLYNEVGEVGDVEMAIEKDTRTSVFLPLQMSPEATIDYWSSDLSWINYEEKILSTVKGQSEKHLFIVKEHPNVFGFRTPGFYDELRQIANVVLVNPEVSSNDLLQICDSVLVCTGTVGFEALVRGKPVFSSSEPFYAEPNAFSSLHDEVGDCHVYAPSELVVYLLSGFLPGTFINDGSWSEVQHSASGYNQQISKSIRGYLSDKLA